MADHTMPRTWRGLALIVAMLMMLVTGCQSTGGADASSGSGGGTGGAQAAAPAAPNPAAKSTEKLCGAPPCVRFMSRSDTKSLADTLKNHPLASTIAVHLALGMLCGGILCLLGEGVSMPFVEKKASEAADQHGCLKVSILPNKDKFSLMSITSSNESPYCTD
ncbi:hypothetical protein GCM10009839_24360 [Catenulispora yoronensis]|uniref:Uncharacterized protein n=1 Tax=Catenulispora yoronensis TaxID=450799 RepID=A0ABP5FJM3_9ACTN